MSSFLHFSLFLSLQGLLKHCDPPLHLPQTPSFNPPPPKSLLVSPTKAQTTVAFAPWWPHGPPSHCYWLSWPARGPRAPRPPCCSGPGRERGTRVLSTSLWSARDPPCSRRRRWWEARGSVSRVQDSETVWAEAKEWWIQPCWREWPQWLHFLLSPCRRPRWWGRW